MPAVHSSWPISSTTLGLGEYQQLADMQFLAAEGCKSPVWGLEFYIDEAERHTT